MVAHRYEQLSLDLFDLEDPSTLKTLEFTELLGSIQTQISLNEFQNEVMASESAMSNEMMAIQFQEMVDLQTA